MFGLRNRRKNKNTPVKTLSRRWKLVLETLEDRLTPAIIVDGTGFNDILLVKSTSPGNYTYQLTSNGVAGPVIAFSNADTSLTFNGLGGDDKLIVDNSHGLIGLSGGITYDGGSGFDTLQTIGTTVLDSAGYLAGPTHDAGVLTHQKGGITQTVTFTGLEPVLDSVVATNITFNATNSDNAINYTQGPGGGIFTGNTGLISVDNLETYEFNNKDNLTINGMAGSDTFNLNNPTRPVGSTPGGLKTITINGNDPTGSDTLIVNGIAGQLDNLRYLPTSVGAGTVINDNAPQPNVLFTGIEHLSEVIQQTDGDGVRMDGTIGNDAIEFFHGLTSDSGSFVGTMDQNNATGVGPFTATPMSFTGAFPLANDADVNFFNPGGTDSFVFNGTGNDDNITIQSGEAGGTEFRNTLNGIVVSRVEVFNTASGLVRGLAGNDTINVNVPAGPAATTLRIEGGDSGDTLNYTALSGATTTIDLGTSTITSPGGNPVTYSGIGKINETSSGAGSTLTINGTAGNDSFTYSPTGANAGTVALAGTNPLVAFTGVGGAFTIDPLAGIDSVTVNGDAANNQITLTGVLGAPTVQVDALKTLTLSTANTESLVVASGLGNDNLTLVSTTQPVLIPVTYDGGSGSDSLTLNGGTASSDIYTPGPNPGSGSSAIVFTSGGGGTQVVNFANLEPVFDNVAATTATINGNNSNNAINYNQGPGGGIFTGNTGLVTIDNQESYEFNNKTNVVINGQAGSDTINLNYSNTANPTGLTGTITVNGGDPTGSDTLIVNGIAGVLDNLRYQPTSVGAGTVINDNEPQPNVLFTGIEHLTEVVQQADGDGVRVDGTIGNDAIEFFHGLTSDSGSFVGTMDQNNATGSGPFTMTPMSFTGASPLANDADVNFFNPGGTDSFVFNGTANDDNIQVGSGEAGGTEFRNTLNGIVVSRVEVFNTASGLVRGLAGNDTINVNVPAGPAAVTLRIEGGDSDQFTDTLNYTATPGAATTVNLGTALISQPGGNPVTYNGVERINLVSSGAGSTLAFVGTAGDDSFNFSPSALGAGSFTASATGAAVLTSPQFTYSGVGGAISVDGGSGGTDTLNLSATNGNDHINVNQTAVNTLSYGQNAFVQLFNLNINNVNHVGIYALGGDDVIQVNWLDALGVDGAINAVSYHVDGGTSFTRDRLSVVDSGTGDLMLYRKGGINTTGSITVGPANIEPLNVDFVNIDVVNPIVGAGGDIVTFKYDPYEYNDDIGNATQLGSAQTINLDPTIDPAGDPVFGLPGDQDVFRLQALNTGLFDIQSLFRQITTVASGRPGLPGNGDLVVSVLDATGAVLATANANLPTGERLVVPVVSGQVYYVRISGANALAINNYSLQIENLAVPVPSVVDLLSISDSGRSDSDNITNIRTSTVDIQADLSALAARGLTVLSAAQATAGTTSGAAVQIFLNGVAVGFADVVSGTDNTHFQFTFPAAGPGALLEGVNQVTAAVRVFDISNPAVSGRGLLGSPPLFITLDTIAPAPPSLFLNPPDDSGIPNQPSTYVDNITKYSAANFTGNSESNSWIQFYALDRTATPQFDGTAPANAFGQYFIDPTFDLNNPAFFDQDGERNLLATASDVAGNQSTPQNLLIFLDTTGPRVAGLTYRYVDANGMVVIVDLLNQTMEGTKVVTPAITYIDVTLLDQPNRTDNFLYPAANELLATTPGNYGIVGKRTGAVTIASVIVLQDDTVSGSIGLTTYRLLLSRPLANDLYKFTIFDRIQDQAGNALDGDFQPPFLPSGDGVPGDNFVAYINNANSSGSGTKLGFYANGSINLDLNGDYIVNPGSTVGTDALIPYAPNGSAVFSGQFYDPNIGTVDGFDRLGTYGKEGGKFAFCTDLNNDGDFSDPGEKTVQTSLQINGMPIAGNWGPSAINLATGRLTGSNVGVFTGTVWYLDTNGNNIIEPAAAGDRVLKGNMRGLPFTGDFDGDGLTDLGTYQNGVFYLDLTTRDAFGLVTGNTNYTFRATLPLGTSGTASKLARPVAADFDGDGITDIGLFIPNQTTVPAGQASWFLMNSNGLPWDLAVPSGTTRGFKTASTGLGTDIAVTYGSAKALPVVGNFDPSTRKSATTPATPSLKQVIANVAHNLTDLYFSSTDSTDFVMGKLRKGKGR